MEPQTEGFCEFPKLTKKTKLPEKFKLPDKRGFEPMKTRRAKFLPPCQPPSISQA